MPELQQWKAVEGTGALLIRDARATAVEGSGRYWSPADKGCQSYSSGRQWKVLEPC